MACKFLDFKVKGDINNALHNTIISDEVAGNNVEKALFLANVINTKLNDFLSFSNKDEYLQKNNIVLNSVEDVIKLNTNTRKKLFRNYYIYTNPDLNNTTTVNMNTDLGMFTNAEAKSTALSYTADLIIKQYIDNRGQNVDVMKEVINIITQDYYNVVDSVVSHILNIVYAENKDSEDYKKYANNSSVKLLIETIDTKNELIKQGRASKDAQERKDIIAKLNALDCQKDAIQFNIIKEFGKDIQKNDFAQNITALYSQILVNPQSWFDSVFCKPEVALFRSLYKNQGVEELNNLDTPAEDANDTENQGNDDASNNPSENNDKDDTARWNNSSVKRHAHDMMSNEFKREIKGLYELDFPYDYENVKEDYQPIYSLDPYLGKKQLVNYDDLMEALIQFTNNKEHIADAETLLIRLKSVSRTKRKFYAIAPLVLKMEKNIVFRNGIFRELQTYRVNKTIGEINENGFRAMHSNASSKVENKLYEQLFSSIRYSYRSIIEQDKNIVDNVLKIYQNRKTDIHKFNESRDRNIQLIKSEFAKCFPNINMKELDNIFAENDYQKEQTIIEALKSIITLANNEAKRYEFDYSEHKLNRAKPFNPINYMSDNNKNITAAVANLTKILKDVISVHTDINHTNAAGNQSSDLLSNTYLSRIIELIQYGNDNEGLNVLKEFLTRSDQYKYNPILFGIKDNNGKYLYNGLFIETSPGQYKVNKDAKYMIDCMLFDGVKNNNNDRNILYPESSKNDYFFTQYLMHRGNISRYTDRKDLTDDMMSLFMKTPSDAPKNFVLLIQRIQEYNCWNITGDVAYINEKLGNIPINNIFKPIFASQTQIMYYNIIHRQLDNQLNDGTILKLHKTSEVKDIALLLTGNIKKLSLGNRGDTSPESAGSERDYYVFNDDDRTTNTKKFIMYCDFDGRTIAFTVVGDKIKLKNKEGKEFFSNNVVENLRVEQIQVMHLQKDSNNRNVVLFEKELPKEFLTQLKSSITSIGIKEGKITKSFNSNNTIYHGYRSRVQNAIELYVKQLNNLFKYNGESFELRKDTVGLFENAHYVKGKLFKKQGNTYQLSGQLFNFPDFPIFNGFNIGQELINELHLYGQTNVENSNPLFTVNTDNNLLLNTTHPLISIDTNTNKIIFNNEFDIQEIINRLTEKFIQNYIAYIKSDISQYSTVVNSYNEEYNDNIDDYDIISFYLSSTLMNMATSDMFEGSPAFYKNSQTEFKRTKQDQMGGKAYAARRINGIIGGHINKMKAANNEIIKEMFNEHTIEITDGFVGATIFNIVKTSNDNTVQTIRKQITDNINKQKNLSDATKQRIIEAIMAPYEKNATTINDAQSYITLEEFIRRRHLDGTLDEYRDLIQQIYDVQDGKLSIAEINLDEINTRIQAQKNVYYDMQYDSNTELYYPRQIKNAEYVLIPCFIKGSDLEHVYNLMRKHNIDQLNTIETSKAANKNVLKLWDPKTGEFLPKFDEKTNDFKPNEFESAFELVDDKGNSTVTETYYYSNLFKQQDIVDHVINASNKVGIQWTKKILDNLSQDEKTQEAARKLIDSYVGNIRGSYFEFLYDMGWKLDEQGNIVNKDGSADLNFVEFYAKMRDEASRLGLNSNSKEYYDVYDEYGVPSMPMELGVNIQKSQSIVNSVFNSHVTRQTIPGWHGPQVCSVGFGVKTANGYRPLEFHPKRYRLKNSDIHHDFVTLDEVKEYVATHDKYKVEDFELVDTNYCEILIPRWNSNIPKYEPISFEEYKKTNKDATKSEYYDYITKEKEKFDREILLKLKEAILDEHIGYRIPTEGKQSMAVFKVVGFVEESLGSTIFVPNEWVTQTGSDFDIDSIYGMCHNFIYDKNNKRFIKYKANYNNTEAANQNRYVRYIHKSVNRKILNVVDSLKLDKQKEYEKLTHLKDIFENNIWDRYKEEENVFQKINDDIWTSVNEYYKDEVEEVKYKDKDGKLVIGHINRYVMEVSKQLKEIHENNTIEYNKDPNKVIINNEKNNIEELNLYEEILLNDAYNDDLHSIEDIENSPDDIREIYQPLLNVINLVKQKIQLTENIKEARRVKQEVLDNFDYIDDIIFSAYQNIAREVGLMTYEDFKSQDIQYQLSEEERNNQIVDAGISILSNGENAEESLSISTFTDIVGDDHGAVDYFMKFFNNREKVNNINEVSFQLQCQENAVVGMALKARSVQFDTTTSLLGQMQASFLEGLGIKVKYSNNLSNTAREVIMGDKSIDLYDLQYISDNYKSPVEGDAVIVNHINFGWNPNGNRNVVGRLISPYSSETTAHILDAIKSGAIPNENLFTFGPFKILISLGVDYFTGVGFLMQPTMSLLSRIYHESNSVYLNETIDVVRKTNYELAKQYGLDLNTKITEYSSIADIDKAFFKQYADTFVKLYGLNKDYINENGSINGTKFIQDKLYIDVSHLARRMENANELSSDERAVMDFVVLKNFEKVNKLYNVLNPLLSCINPDKYGAKQTSYLNNEILKKIYKLGFDKNNEDLKSIVCNVNSKSVPVLDALYPNLFGIYNEETHLYKTVNPEYIIKESLNPYMASFLLYSTIPSTIVSSKLFRLERNGFNTPYYMMPQINNDAEEYKKTLDKKVEDEIMTEYEAAYELKKYKYNKFGLSDKIQDRLGIKFTDEQYTEFQKWIIASTYYNNPNLTSPITVDEKTGFFIQDEKRKEEYKNNSSYWKTEVNRVFGYEETVDVNHKFSENVFIKAKDTDIEIFAKFTPAQKIAWLKTNYLGGAEICNYLELRQVKNNNLLFTRIRFDEQQGIESMLMMFNNLYFNRHPFARLLALDLIKYAFLVEGFDFKYGGISKIITNRALLSGTVKGPGFAVYDENKNNSFIDSINMHIDEILNYNYDSNEQLEKYVKSHPQMAKEVKFNKYGKFTNDSNTTKLEDLEGHKVIGYNDVYYIPVANPKDTAHSTDLAKMFIPTVESLKEYVRIKTPSEDGYTTKLYKIHYNFNGTDLAGILLYQIGTLSTNEFGDFSVVNENNTTYNYKELIESEDGLIAKMKDSTFFNRLIRERSFLAFNSAKDLLEKKNKHLVPRFEQKVVESSTYNVNDEQLLMKEKNNNPMALSAITGIETYLEKIPDIEEKQPYYVIIPANTFMQEITKGRTIIQEINGVRYSIFRDTKNNPFGRYTKEVKSHNTAAELTRNKIITGIFGELKSYLTTHQDLNTYNADTYVIIKQPTTEKDTSVQDELKEVIDRTNMNSSIGCLELSEKLNYDRTISNLERMSAKFAKYLEHKMNEELRKKNYTDTLSEYRQYINSGFINLRDSESIFQHKEDIFNFMRDYIEEKAAILNDKINEYTLKIDGENVKFKLNDKELYEALLKMDDDEAFNVIDLIMEAKNFGKEIEDDINIDIELLDGTVKNNLQVIREKINLIANSSIINGMNKETGALHHLFETYIKNKYSTNELKDIIDIRTTFDDINFVDKSISSMTEISNKEIQTTNKMIMRVLTDVRQRVTKDKIINFNREFNEYGGNIVADKLIDKTGQYIKPYNTQFIEDKQKMIEEAVIARNKHNTTYKAYSFANIRLNNILDKKFELNGHFTPEFIEEEKQAKLDFERTKKEDYEAAKEYYWAKLKKDEWFAENIEQVAVQSYYLETNANMRNVLENAQDEFIEYKRLKQELRDLCTKDNITEQERYRIMEINKVLVPKILENKHIEKFVKTNNEIMKKYREKKYTTSWQTMLDANLQIVNSYDARHNEMPLSDKLMNPDYNKAYNWLLLNANYRIKSDILDKIHEVFNSLQSTGVENEIELRRNLFNSYGAYDRFGNPDPTRLSYEAIRSYKEAFEEAMNERTADPDASLLLKNRGTLSDVRSNEFVMFSKKFYDLFKPSSTYINPQEKQQKLNLITEINDIIRSTNAMERVADIDGIVNTKLNISVLFHELSYTQLEELCHKLEALEFLNKNSTKDPAVTANFKKYAGIMTDSKQFNTDRLEIQNADESYISSNKKALFDEYFTKKDEDGNKLIDGLTGNFIGSDLIYGILVPRKADVDPATYKEFLDEDRKNAIKFIRRNISFNPSHYYVEAAKQAKADGRYEEWFELNHVYNPVERRFEPLRIWTELTIKEGSEFNNAYEWVPYYDNIQQVFKNGKESEQNPKAFNALNPNHTTTGNNYNISTGRYTNPEFLNIVNNKESNEFKMYKLLTKTAMDYAYTEKYREFSQQFAPREYDVDLDVKEIAKEIIGVFGVNLNTHNGNWIERVDYVNDRMPDFSMFELLKNKKTKKREEFPIRLANETDEHFNQRVKEVKEKNKKIDEENLAIDNSMLNRNWAEVFKNLIIKGEDMNARQKVKNTIYLMIDELATNDAYEISAVTGRLRKNSYYSIDDNIKEFKKIKQLNMSEMYQTFARRIIYDIYRKESKFNPLFQTIQGYTSTKYMAVNIPGGIANVVTGNTNMIMEMAAGEYYTKEGIRKGTSRFMGSIVSIVADTNKDDASSLESGLVQLFSILDYDEHIGERDLDGLRKLTKKVNQSMYMPNTSGEFMMHNIALFSGIEDNRVYQDKVTGQYVIGTLNDYNRSLERIALKQALSEYSEQHGLKADIFEKAYKSYIKNIKNDVSLQLKYDTYQEDINANFLKLIVRNYKEGKELNKKYLEVKKRLLEESEKKFNSEETLISQFEFVTTSSNGRGVTRLKKDSKLFKDYNDKYNENHGYGKLADFINKTRKVNDKIHGIYDKLGRATIENYALGALAMQYHKHIYPGFMKRYRGAFGGMFGNKAYYNELRGTIEKGAYVSLVQFAFTDTRDAIRKLRSGKKEEFDNEGNLIESDITTIESIQEVIKSLINNVAHLRFNYNNMPEWEKANCRRAIAEALRIMGSVGFIVSLYGIADDEEEKNNMLYANLMYVSARCFSEAYMWYPTGLVSEAETLWSSPIAGFSGISDMFKGVNLITSALFDEEFEPEYTTGKYKGRNKFEVLITRNTPGMRIYNGIINRAQNNSYYNGSTSTSSAQSKLKDISDIIFDK